MKKLFLLFTLFICMKSFATIRTVCNVPTNLAQFSTIQAAIDASVSGDSIYVIGSPNTYDAFSITDKRLAIFGAGWSPDKQISLSTNLLGGTITGSTSSGCELQGLTFIQNLNILSPGINDLKFIRNRFSRCAVTLTPSVTGNFSGYLFEGNWIENGQINSNANFSFTNFMFHNNIFYNTTCCFFGNLSGFTNCVNVAFDHNLWYGPSSGSSPCFNNNCRFLTISNNIFIERDAATNNSFSTFNNNITFKTGDDTAWIRNNNADAGGNIAGKSPQMVDEVSVEAGTNDPLLNFTIPSGIANNAGSDGKDLGLLFDVTGSLNWANSRQPRLPFVFSMNVTTPTVQAGATVSVTVEARKND